MSFLHRLFENDEALAREIAEDETAFQRSMESFLAASKAKQDAISIYSTDTRSALMTLLKALSTELALIAADSRTEKQMVGDLKDLLKKSHRKEFEKLVATMSHAANQEEFTYNLLLQLHELLLDEGRTVHALSQSPSDATLVARLTEQIAVEQDMVNKLPDEKELFEFYHDLALGEHRKIKMDKEKNAIAEQIYNRIIDAMREHDIYFKPTGENEDSINFLTIDCFEKLEDEVAKAIEADQLEKHPRVNYEFVNGPLFEVFVLKEINKNNLRGINDKMMIRRFIEIFREQLFNTRIEEDLP